MAPRGILLWIGVASALLAGVQAPPAPRWDVHAVRYATLPAFRLSSLVAGLAAGPDRSRTLDIAMMVWVIRGPNGRVVLVDTGFHDEKFLQQWKPTGYAPASDAVQAGLGIAPDQITDIILTHIHWDHADGVDLFSRAKVWIQREEYAHHIDDAGQVRDAAIDAVVAAKLFAVRAAGRLALVDGDNQEIMPGVRVYTGGKHTFASQFVGVATRSGTVVLASDNAYLYENLERRLAIAQTLDPASNLAAQGRMLMLAASLNRIVPGHDPAVFERFAQIKPGVVRID